MATLIPVSGAQFYIGSTITLDGSDLTEGDFSGISWTEVTGWETMGGLGDAAEIIRTILINEGRVNKAKGTRDAGTMENRFARITGDSGQAAMETAEGSNSNYAFKIEFDDQPSGGSNPTTLYFAALVASKNRVGGDANTVDMKVYNCEVNSNVVEVAAA